MYFFSRDKKPNLDGLSSSERRAATDAWDKAQSMSLRECAAERRKQIKQVRIADYALRPDLVRRAIAESRAIRRNMERRINEL